MPRDKSENHEKIIAAAYEEFKEYGFEEASLRRIAAACDMSVSGLYKHFPSKEDMFASLVRPAIDGLLDLYHQIEKEYFDDLTAKDITKISNSKREMVRAMEYIYDHFKEFELIICKSKGSEFHGFKHDMANLEEQVTLKYMEELKKKGVPVKDINRSEFHLLVSASIGALFEAVIHGFTKDEALHFAGTLEDFYEPAWKQFFGI